MKLVHEIGEQHDIENGQVQSLFYYIMEFGLINVVSFNDELEHHLIPELKKSLYPEKESLSIFIRFWRKEIRNKFKDLKDFRDHYLAHNIRINKIENTLTSGRFRLYRVPQNPLDYYYLVTIIKAINNVLTNAFPDAYKKIEYQRLVKNSTIPLINPIFSDVNHMNNYYLEKVSELEAILH